MPCIQMACILHNFTKVGRLCTEACFFRKCTLLEAVVAYFLVHVFIQHQSWLCIGMPGPACAAHELLMDLWESSKLLSKSDLLRLVMNFQ